MASKNSKMKNIFHLPFLKCMHFSTMQNYLTRGSKVLLGETRMTGSNNKKTQFLLFVALPLFPYHFYFQQEELREKQERAQGGKVLGVKKKGREAGGYWG